MSDFTALLDELPVPEHAPDFWDRLEGALDGVDPGDDAGTPALIDPLTGDDLRGDAEPTVDLETRRRTRRWLAIAIAAAVVVLIAAIAGINALTEDSAPGPVVTDPTPPPTPSRPPTPDRPAIADAPLTWSPTEANLETENGVIVGANETGYFAFAPPPLGGLLRSDDGLQWEPIDARSIMVDGTSPSWSADATTTEFPTAGVEISSHGVLVAEISHRDATDPRLRIWRSADGEQWTLDEVELVEASLRDHVGVAPGQDFLEAPPVLIASSPDTVVARLSLDYIVDWWRFDPGSFDPDNESAAGQMSLRPTDEGLVIVEPFPLDAEVGSEPPPRVVPWDDLDPDARRVHEWLEERASGAEIIVVGEVGLERIASPLTSGFGGGLRWDGERFEMWTDSITQLGLTPDDELGAGAIAYSTDGRQWSEPIRLPDTVAVIGTIDGTLVAVDGQIDSAGELAYSTDRGQTFRPVELDLSGFEDPERAWGTSFANSTWGVNDVLEFDNGPRIQQGIVTIMATRGDTRDVWLLRSANGIDWTVSPIDRGGEPTLDEEIEGEQPVDETFRPRTVGVGSNAVQVVIGPDGAAVLYSEDGTDIGVVTDPGDSEDDP